eukprot:8934510-Alexandrium_andersonii.AAC.1
MVRGITPQYAVVRGSTPSRRSLQFAAPLAAGGNDAPMSNTRGGSGEGLGRVWGGPEEALER